MYMLWSVGFPPHNACPVSFSDWAVDQSEISDGGEDKTMKSKSGWDEIQTGSEIKLSDYEIKLRWTSESEIRLGLTSDSKVKLSWKSDIKTRPW